MKVLACGAGAVKPVAPAFLSFEEIQKQEGVYTWRECAPHNGRFIVLKHGNLTITVLFYDGIQLIPVSLNASGYTRGFSKTNEQVCFELKSV